MSTVKSSPFSSRTKSLRERFGSKRSYSESFKDPPVTASEPTATMGSPDLSAHRPTFPSIPAQRIAASTGQLRYSPLQSDEFNPYAALPEETYCSALDINSQEGDPRFPWQRDAAIQCDMSSEEASSYTTAGSIRGHSPDYRSSTVEGLLSAPQGSRTQSPTHGGTARTRWGTEALTSSPQKESPKRRSMLQRAMSLERGRSKGGLKHQASLDETREIRTASGNKQMYVPHHVQTLTPSLESQASIESSSPTSKDSLHSFNSYGGPVTSGHTSSNTSVYSVTSSGSTTPSVTPPQSPPTSSACSRKPSLSERKKLGFLRKQTNSAPESFEDTTTPTPERPTPQASNYFNFECMQRLLEMSIKATGSQTGALAENRNFLLNIPTHARDGKSPAGYLSLPSPNLQGEENESSNVFKRLSSAGANNDQENESEQDEVQEEPPASALHRRRALVPPKMLTDGYESASEETDRSSMCHSQSHLNLPGDSKNRRRSSIVVIPPMQICPGDLLVYGKVLGNRNNLLDLDGSTQCLAVTDGIV